MQPSSNQFGFQLDSPDYSRGVADVVKSIDHSSGIDTASRFAKEPLHEHDSKEDKIAKATMYALSVLEQTSAPADVVEHAPQPTIAEYMKHIGDIGLLIDTYRDQETSK